MERDDAEVREIRIGGWSLLPLAALLGGVWAGGPDAGGNLWTEGALSEAAAAIALLLAGWLPLWNAIAVTDWTLPLHRWRSWGAEDVQPFRLPYVQPGTPGAALGRSLAVARAWWKAEGRRALSSPLRSALLALVVSLLLSAALGRLPLLLTFLVLAGAQLAALWGEGQGYAGTGWEALAMVGVPWLLGTTLVAPHPSLLSASVVTLLVSLYAVPGPVAVLGPVLTVALVTLTQKDTFAAGVLLLLSLPGLLLLARERVSAPEYRATIAPWMLGMLLLLGWMW